MALSIVSRIAVLSAALLSLAGCATPPPPDPLALTDDERTSAAAILARYIQDEFAPGGPALAIDGPAWLASATTDLLRASGYAIGAPDAVPLYLSVDPQDEYAVVRIDGPSWSAGRICTRRSDSLRVAGPFTIFRHEQSASSSITLP